MNKSDRESSKKQRQLIAMACTHFAMARDDKKAMLLERYGKESTTDLTYAQAEELIDDFVDRGYVIKSKKRRYLKRRRPFPGGQKRKTGNMVALASQAELAKIDALAGLITWRVENGMERWMEKRFRITRVKTAGDALKVIEGLKGMFENQMKKQFGPDWWQEPHEDIEICWYIVEYFPHWVNEHLIPAAARFRDHARAGQVTGIMAAG